MAAEEIKTTPAETSGATVVADAPTKPKSRPSTPDTPLASLNARLDDIFNQTSHKEMWGVQLSNIEHIPTMVVLQKFLRANNGNVDAAEKQLTNALKWRKNMNPSALVHKTFNKKKFDDLGFVTIHQGDSGKEIVITWNVYGAVKNKKATFGDVREFVKWRAAIMELSVQKLQLDQVTEAIPEDGEDPYQMIQVHDYQNVSFLRMDPAVKAASKETIAIFAMAYPELLSHKYFVNVPAIMGWMFGAMKLVLPAATLRKFHPLTSGTSLATELKDIVSTLPKEYGGQGPSVKEGLKVSLAQEVEALAKTPAAEAATESTPRNESVAPDDESLAVGDVSLEELTLLSIGEPFKNLALRSVEETLAADKKTAVAIDMTKKTPSVIHIDKETASGSDTKETASGSDTDKETTPATNTDKEIAPVTDANKEIAPEADPEKKETASGSDTRKETAPVTNTFKETTPAIDAIKETTPEADPEKKEIAPVIESEPKDPVPVSQAEKKETAA
ncbi:hypothetical protein LCI18_002435 [Fusarium solani-melongenae]|uniref:Uncharacterized protein n=1 Tax=Fusarium solani subsp. cucurbitae TaxID=2747967 RepID=A0ACD3YRC7_FUSSC|nr:hypothetical protein LCI18_002435 [Fusarium solani-melongenae]